MMLSQKQMKYLKGLGHHLDPVVFVGKAGCSTDVIKALDTAFDTFELIKVKMLSDDREERVSFSEAIAYETRATRVQMIGKMALFYKKAMKKVKKPVQLPSM